MGVHISITEMAKNRPLLTFLFLNTFSSQNIKAVPFYLIFSLGLIQKKMVQCLLESPLKFALSPHRAKKQNKKADYFFQI